MIDFIHLRVATDFSLLQSTNRIKDLVNLATEMNYPSLCIADQNNLFGCLEFANECMKNKIQSIIGVKIQIHHHEKSGNLLFLVTDECSYYALIDIVAQIDLNEKHINFEKLLALQWGNLICLSGFENGLLAQFLTQEEKMQEILQKIKNKLPNNHFFLEIQRFADKDTNLLEKKWLELAKNLNLPLVATNDVCFLKKDNFSACDALWAMSEKSWLSDDNRKQLSVEQYLKSEIEMKELFRDLPSALKNTVRIAQMCHFWPEPRDIQFPIFQDHVTNLPSDELIVKKSQKGLNICLMNFIFPRDFVDFQNSDFVVLQFFDYFLQYIFLQYNSNHLDNNFLEQDILDLILIDVINFDTIKNQDLQNAHSYLEFLNLFLDSPSNILFADIENFLQHFSGQIAEKIHNISTLQKMFHVEQFDWKNLNLTAERLYELLRIKHKYQQRLDYEMKIITKMGFSSYFLIVSDFIIWAKNNDIPVGPGRGSGAGSLVAWTLEITDYDPIYFGLLFERFLNPDRISMPDFDIDFCQSRRDEVVKYVVERYGRDHVANIITFGTMQARGVLRDVGRVLQMPYSQVDKICKIIPNSPTQPITLAEALERDEKLQEERKNSEVVDQLFEISLQLEGLHRHTSLHAAGVVIGAQSINKMIPIHFDPETNSTVTQFSMKYAEMSGLIKFDFLGLKTLTVLQQIKVLVRKNHQKDIDFRFLTLDDVKTFEMLSEGDNIGIFQLENSFMSLVLKDLKPTHINDLIALVSLNRPGPMDNIPSYIARKHGREKITYDHPMLADVLEETFGIIIYQEQVMKIAQVMGGYSLGQADILRRAMGKKIQSEMDKQQSIFVEGAIKNNVDRKKAEQIFQLVNKFAGYGFNKSHATGYALISYFTAYLKANYTLEFFTAVFNLDIMDTDKCALFLLDAKKHDVEILSPCVNHSSFEFLVENQAIRYALSACKNVGINVGKMILMEREKNGKFKDIFDFVGRFDTKAVNKKTLESLIKVGAFDSIHNNRQQLFMAVASLLTYSNAANQERSSNQISIFNNIEYTGAVPELPQTSDWDHEQRLQFEFENFGFFFKEHSLDNFEKQLIENNFVFSHQIHNQKVKTMKMTGVVHDFAVRSTPRGKMAIMKMSDSYGQFKMTIYDAELLQDEFLIVGQKLMMQVAVKALDGGDIRIFAKKIKIFNVEELSSMHSEENSKNVEKKVIKVPYDHAIPINNNETIDSESSIPEDILMKTTPQNTSHHNVPQALKTYKIFVEECTDLHTFKEIILGEKQDELYFEFIENGKLNLALAKQKFEIANNMQKLKKMGYKIGTFDHNNY